MAAATMAAAVVFAACATASLPPTPTTYRPSWSTAAHAASPTAATHEAGQPSWGRHSVTQDQPQGPGTVRPREGASSGGVGRLERVVLREEVYQGQARLVYRLAPGAIFAGVRTHRLPGGPDAGRRDTRGGSGARPPKKYHGHDHKRPRKPVKTNTKPPGFVAAGWTVTPPDLQRHRQPPPAPRRPPPRWDPLASLRANLATLSSASLGAVRSVRLIVMIMQYLGFIPPLPGLPAHGDPVHSRPSTQYTLDRGEAPSL